MKALGWPVACDGFGSAVRGNPKLEFPHQPGIQIKTAADLNLTLTD